MFCTILLLDLAPKSNAKSVPFQKGWSIIFNPAPALPSTPAPASSSAPVPSSPPTPSSTPAPSSAPAPSALNNVHSRPTPVFSPPLPCMGLCHTTASVGKTSRGGQGRHLHLFDSIH